MAKLIHKTKNGAFYHGDSVEELKSGKLAKNLKGKVNLILTSPPFPLNLKKSYGNLQGEDYKKWLSSLAEIWSELLAPDGSIVIELGNAWEKGRPIQSLLHLESLIGFARNKKAKLNLCQQFICYNPSRLPSPANWVTINRIRFTDSYTHVWWFSKSDFPKADNSKVLRPYSKSMEQLLKRGKYNAGKRHSEHVISEKGFLTNHGGSIMHNFIECEPMEEGVEPRLPRNAFSIANTCSNDFFLKKCRELKITPHPARMSIGLAKLFIEFLTEEGDIVLDPFGGSNTTGFAAETLNRKWVSLEISENFLEQSKVRFSDPVLKKN